MYEKNLLQIIKYFVSADSKKQLIFNYWINQGFRGVV